MEGYLQRRLNDPRYANAQRAVVAPPTAQVPWYAGGNASAPPQQLHFSKYEASAKKDEGGGDKAKKKRSKDSKDSKKSDSSGSESDGKGGRRKKEKKKGRCWKGYKPTPGKEPYSEGSCMKA